MAPIAWRLSYREPCIQERVSKALQMTSGFCRESEEKGFFTEYRAASSCCTTTSEMFDIAFKAMIPLITRLVELD